MSLTSGWYMLQRKIQCLLNKLWAVWDFFYMIHTNRMILLKLGNVISLNVDWNLSIKIFFCLWKIVQLKKFPTNSSPPFQISKRGWGEFPVRVQLYFHSHLNQKPLQIFHTLILDKKHTGMQTMGEFEAKLVNNGNISVF